VALIDKGFYSELIGIGITAAGPLPSLTEFPFKPFRAPEQLERLLPFYLQKVKATGKIRCGHSPFFSLMKLKIGDVSLIFLIFL